MSTLSATIDTVGQEQCDAMGSRLATISSGATHGEAPRGPSRQRAAHQPEALPLNFSKYFVLIEALAGGALRGKSLLDVGCGAAGIVAQAKGLGMHAVGIDLYAGQSDSRGAAEAMLRAHGVPATEIATSLRNADITQPPEDLLGRFDFAVSIGMLEHIPEARHREAAVTNMVRVLRPGGTMILTCGPNRRVPFDLFHYGPRFPLYHWLPAWAKARYLRWLIIPRRPDVNAVQSDPRFLTGVSVAEIVRAARSVDPDAEIVQAFRLITRLAVSRRWLRRRRVQALIGAVSRLLVRLKMEPLIVMVVRRSPR